jgi:hypothetical protein
VDARAGSGKLREDFRRNVGALTRFSASFTPKTKGEKENEKHIYKHAVPCNSSTATAPMNQTGPPKSFTTRLRTATLHASMQEKMKRVGISLAMGLLAAILGAGVANAEVVAVTNEQFPTGSTLPGGDTLKAGCETETAQQTIIDTAGMVRVGS